ncbi:natriuretic peptides B isoform X1 [Manis javanica]|uniref:natriuretic peptides B isoform X1 n=1 Tax=Manis javanica TaxID=9974 RepID=UPI0008136B67
MDPQTVLPRALLLFLFLHLSPLGGRSSPLPGPSTSSDLSGMQELLDGLRDTVSELQAEQMALELPQQVRVLEEAWEATETASSGVSGPLDSTLQARRGLRSPKMMRNSGCFGRRLDRIGSLSGLGCNDEETAAQRDGLL